jgi:hypothetical protein
MYIRRAGKKPVAILTARDNNIAGNVKNETSFCGYGSLSTPKYRQERLFFLNYP